MPQHDGLEQIIRARTRLTQLAPRARYIKNYLHSDLEREKSLARSGLILVLAPVNTTPQEFQAMRVFFGIANRCLLAIALTTGKTNHYQPYGRCARNQQSIFLLREGDRKHSRRRWANSDRFWIRERPDNRAAHKKRQLQRGSPPLELTLFAQGGAV